jgi:hypothetical protein
VEQDPLMEQMVITVHLTLLPPLVVAQEQELPILVKMVDRVVEQRILVGQSN